MRYLSLCSGIGADSVAWTKLGLQPLAFAEIDEFCNLVLQFRFPKVPNLGDILKLETYEIKERFGTPDVIVAGTPCQPFSISGIRMGTVDPRGKLTLRFVRLVCETRPPWVVWENVPGVLSIDSGRVFRYIVETLTQSGYGVAWRVLDAQHFGVPQRRRRIFLVGCLGDWKRAAAVLFDLGDVSVSAEEIPHAETEAEAEVGTGAGARSAAETGCGERVTGTLLSTSIGNRRPGHGGDDVDRGMIVVDRRGPRILTPLECERLQGLPDNWTLVPVSRFDSKKVTKARPEERWRFDNGKWVLMAADADRYRAVGNSMAVPVMEWIGRRIRNGC